MTNEADDHPSWQPPRIALVLQGGGALGAYQGGVYQALSEQGLEPDWIVGTSIGAINGAVLAGNTAGERVDRLKEFWDIVGQDDIWNVERVPEDLRSANIYLTTLGVLASGIPGFFSPRRLLPPLRGDSGTAETCSFYDTAPLRETLERLVSFELINAEEGTRLTVGAVDVTSGKLVYFDSAKEPLAAAHVMASGSLPPGFPAVRIGDDLYWDGGLYSNTPIDAVIDDVPQVDTLCFMVDLWHAEGSEPRSMAEVRERQNDILYASRSRHDIRDYRRMQQIRRAFQALREKLPSELQELPEMQRIGRLLSAARFTIIRLTYPERGWDMSTKSIDFSRASIKSRWDQGYSDAMRAVGQEEWLRLPTDGADIYELGPEEEEKAEKAASAPEPGAS